MKNTANTVIEIALSDVKSLIHSVKNGKIFGIVYTYKSPKCGKCGRKSVKFQNGLKICDKCGGEVVFERKSLAQKGVKNPAHATPPGKGAYAGITAKEAEERYNNFLHYDRNCGSYRNAGFDHIRELHIAGVTYIVK